jgi:FAD/FMN-containing dehydrogenase
MKRESSRLGAVTVSCYDSCEVTLPRHSSHFLELARKGAEHRYQELKAELATLKRTFPNLGERAGRALGDAVNTAERTVNDVARRRRRMSAAARRAVSERMKRYWAARRAGKKK